MFYCKYYNPQRTGQYNPLFIAPMFFSLFITFCQYEEAEPAEALLVQRSFSKSQAKHHIRENL